MNKKGSLGVAIISSIMIFLIGLAAINLLMPEVNTFRTDMECSDTANISDGTKLTCLVGDLVIPYFILLVLSAAVGGIISRFVF